MEGKQGQFAIWFQSIQRCPILPKNNQRLEYCRRVQIAQNDESYCRLSSRVPNSVYQEQNCRVWCKSLECQKYPQHLQDIYQNITSKDARQNDGMWWYSLRLSFYYYLRKLFLCSRHRHVGPLKKTGHYQQTSIRFPTCLRKYIWQKYIIFHRNQLNNIRLGNTKNGRRWSLFGNRVALREIYQLVKLGWKLKLGPIVLEIFPGSD